MDKLAPFWSTIQADLERLGKSDRAFRVVMRGVVSPGFQAIFVYRLFRWFYERNIPTQPLRFFFERIIEISTGISIPVQAKIGKGFRIHHFGNIILHPHTVIGEGCTVFQGVTLGDLGEKGGAPCLGSHILVGAGAKLLGNIKVGDYCSIGANAVVLRSIPSHSIAVGVPAIIKKKGGVVAASTVSEMPETFNEGK